MPVDPVGHIPPSCYDVFITDIDEKDLSAISDELDVQQLGTAENVGQIDSITGIFYGENFRLFIPMVVERRGKRIWVLFLFDTGSPHTFLRKETWKALGYSGQVDIPASVNVGINDIPTAVSMSKGDTLENVDLLGSKLPWTKQECE